MSAPRFEADQTATSTDLNLLAEAADAQPPIAALRMSSTTNAANATYTPLPFDTTDIDAPDGHTAPGTEYDAQVSGWYLCTGTVVFGADTDGLRIAQFRVNGTLQDAGIQQVPTVTSGGSGTALTAVALLYLTAGDALELVAYHTAGGTITVRGWLSVVLQYAG